MHLPAVGHASVIAMPTSRVRPRRTPPSRFLRAGSLLVALSAVARPVVAQQLAGPVADSLQVRRGDTLWGIARDRLGSPYRWSDIFTLNVGVVSDPHWIYPGQRLRLPGGSAQAAPAAPADAIAVAEPESEEMPSSASLAFIAHRITPAPATPASGAGRRLTAADTIRSGEWFTVPFVAAPGAPRGSGKVVAGIDVGPKGAHDAERRFQRYDRLVLTLPSDVAATVGNVVLLVRRGPDLRGGQVLLPTGIAVIDGVQNGMTTARLTRVFDDVQGGQAVVALPAEPAMATSGAATPLESRIAWISGSAELPTLYGAFVIAAGAREGVREGDRFEVVAEGRRLDAETRLPETRSAIARVIRVTEYGATALIVSQEQPAVAAGMRVRRLTTR
jgi:hypothetical protein